MKESLEPPLNIIAPKVSLESAPTTEGETPDETVKFIKDGINLKFSGGSKMKTIREVKEKFGLSTLEASNLVVSVISDLRVNRAMELLDTSTREDVIEQLKKEWGNGGKVKREEAERIGSILTKTIDKALEKRSAGRSRF